MTGLAGIWRFDGGLGAADDCARVLQAQEIYGPHAVGQWSNGDVACGRRLMRVLPEDVHDRQPLIGGAGRFVLVADVRLDNRGELIEALEISSGTARQLCDAAILLAAFERWEESCIDRLVGDFALALWDNARRRLLLARDPLGQRPLHYHRGHRFFAFASMPKGLHALKEIPYAPDEDRIAQFLVLMPETGPQSFFEGIERVEAGHVVVISATNVTPRRYWQPSRKPIRFRTPDEYSNALRDLLDQAVRCRLRGVETVGAELSGGLDSSAVTATAARLLAPSHGRVVAFTAAPREGYVRPGSSEAIFDEQPYAAATVAMYPNMEHVVVRTPGRSPLDDLDRNFLLYDRPVLNICNTGWVHGIYDAVRQRGLPVLLTGLMGDEGLSYGGMTLLPELFRQGRWIQWCRTASALVARQRMSWLRMMSETLGPWFPAAAWLWLNRVRRGVDFEIHSAINPRRFAELDLARRGRVWGFDPAYRPWKDGFSERLAILGRVDIGNYNKGTLGGWRIDRRHPAADIRLIEFCLNVPTEQFLRDGSGRALGRRALSDRLPERVLQAGSCVQGADWHERMTAVRTEVKAELDRIETCAPAGRALDLARLRRLVDRWPSGGWDRYEVTARYRLALLRGLSTGHFLRRTAGGNQ